MFEVGGKCLAYHGPLLYEAKILRRWNPKLEKVEYSVPLKSGEEDGLPESMNREEFYYYIHYQGWKSSWDEWVSVDRIMELTEANIELKKQLVMEAKKASLAQQQKTKNGGSAKRGGGGAHSESNHGSRRSGSGIVGTRMRKSADCAERGALQDILSDELQLLAKQASNPYTYDPREHAGRRLGDSHEGEEDQQLAKPVSSGNHPGQVLQGRRYQDYITRRALAG